MASSRVSRLRTLTFRWYPEDTLYASMRPTRFVTCSSLVRPRPEGTTVEVSEIPSIASEYGSFATDMAEASMPCESRPFIGLAPGANGSPARRPSGVLPVALPYTTFEVIVSTDCVCSALRYVLWWRIFSMKALVMPTAMSSARSSSLPYFG
jgi:hypothetical protein